MIVPTLRVGMPPWTLCVRFGARNAERPEMHSHAERGNDHVCTTRSTVGASLLAIAVYQATSMLDVLASSRAGSLPQGIRVRLSLLTTQQAER